VAEWLGSALQKLLQQFESVRYLKTRCVNGGFFSTMLTKEDENFLKYWSVQREKKRTFYGMASVGFRLGVFIVIGLALSLFAAKFSRKANPVLENNTSLIITVMIAGLAIVFFITYFSAQHKWDQNDLHYQELLRDKAQQDKMQHSGK
jgi:heme/copper-type cytochrome/quinol oxidase subunit 2